MDQKLIFYWGNNQQNILSTSSTKSFSSPHNLLTSYPITQISASEKHISFITSLGQLYSYGINLDGRLGCGGKSDLKYSVTNPVRIKINGLAIRVKCGFSHVCVMLDSGELWAWGLGDYGSLGIGEFRSKSIPNKVKIGVEVKQFSCGAMHTGFIDFQGNVFTCGSNQYGELGMNRPEKVATPILITFNQKVKKIECGVFYTLLLTAKGQVYGMGNNKYGQLGIGHKVNQCHPTLIRQLDNIVAISAGYHSGAIDQEGNLYIWGSGTFGELLRPKKFVLEYPVDEIYIRGFYGVAISNKGQKHFYVWGNNTFGELACGNFEHSKQIVEVKQLEGIQIQSIACGVNFCVAIARNSNKTRELDSQQIQKYRSKVDNIRGSVQKYVRKFEQETPQIGNYYSRSPIRNRTNRFQHISQHFLDDNQALETRLRRSQQKGRELEDYILDRNKRYEDNKIQKEIIEDQIQRSRRRDYESLFINLSTDYEHLCAKYKVLQEQLQNKNIMQRNINSEKQTLLMKDISILNEELLNTKSDLRTTLKKLSILEQQLLLKSTSDRHFATSRLEISEKIEHQNLLMKEQILLLKQEKATSEIRKEQFQKQISLFKEEMILKDRLLQQYKFKGSQIPLQFQKILNDKERYISQLVTSHENSIQDFEELNNKYRHQNKELSEKFIKRESQMRALQEVIKQNQKIMQALENKYTQDIVNAQSNTIKLKQIQELNEVRAQQLKILLDTEQRKKKSLQKQIEIHHFQVSQFHKEKQELFKMIQAQKNQKEKDVKIYLQKITEIEDQKELIQEKIKQGDVQVNYEKDYNKKCQETIKNLTEKKDKSLKQIHQLKDDLEKERNKIKQIGNQIQKGKILKKQNDKLNITIQRINNEHKEYQHQIEGLLRQKEQIVRQMRNEAQKKQKEFEKLQEKSQDQISGLNRQMRDVQKKLNFKTRQYGDLKKDYERRSAEMENLRDALDKSQRKLIFKTEQMEKQILEREKTEEQFTNLRRQYSKLKAQKQDAENKIQQVSEDLRSCEHKLNQKKKQISIVEEEVQRVQKISQNLRKQTEISRKQMQEAQWALEESNKVNDQLQKANKEFADNEEHFTNKISSLEGRLFELQDENKSYTPRYEALLLRNRQLDEKNRQLSEMVNKAIQIQAQAYKSNILKEVEINTGEILQQIKDQQEFKVTNRRREEYHSKEEIQNSHLGSESFVKTPGMVSKVKDEPYTKMMTEKITQHKKKVSESAQKLANILDMSQKGNMEGQVKEYSRSINFGRNQDIEEVNNKMESLNQQKKQFMSKISSFAQKLKIL